jgi:hypothetical protein
MDMVHLLAMVHRAATGVKDRLAAAVVAARAATLAGPAPALLMNPAY